MRRFGDLDSNCLVAARPYCNGRAIVSDKVLKRSKPVVCADEQKMTRRGKASVVGFHRPDSGTARFAGNSKSQTPSSKETQSSKISKTVAATLRFCFGDFCAIWNLGFGISTSVIEVALRTLALRDSPASTILHALLQFAGSMQDRFPIHRVSS